MVDFRTHMTEAERIEAQNELPHANYVLDTVRKVLKQRRESYGNDVGKSFRQISQFWSAYLGISISCLDVSMMMILLKVSREQSGHNVDNISDICGYAALVQEMLFGGSSEKNV